MQFTSQLEQGDWYVLAGWLCVVGALLLYGLGIALNTIWSRLPLRRWRASTARTRRQLVLVRGQSERPRAAGTQTASNSHWSRVREIVEAGVHRTEAISAWHAAAGRQIDAAEYALNGLIADCAKVMRMPAPVPAAPAPLPRPAQAPLSQPLAA
jgi:hypothetical protein